MRQACGGPPALSQINHAADPVPSAWGPNRARMLSLSHGPGPLSSPQHSTQLLWGSRGMGGWNAPERHALLPFFPFSFCGHQEIDAGREKQKRPSHLPSAAAATTAPFYCSSEGPVGSGQALQQGCVCVWGGGSVCQGPPALAWKQLTDVSVHRRTADAIVASTVAGLGTSFHLPASFDWLVSWCV